MSLTSAPLNGSDPISWLRAHSVLGELSTPALRTLLATLETRQIPAGEVIVEENAPVTGLFILQAGDLECTRPALGSGPRGIALSPGELINLQELLLKQPALGTVRATSQVTLGFIPARSFRHWINNHPEANQIFSRWLAQELAQISAQLSYEQQRQAELLPYRVPKVERGVVGNSRYAVRLRQQIIQATEDRESVLIFGEPGLEKDNLAALIHFSSSDRRSPLIKLNCRMLQPSGADLFGRAGGKPGLLAWLGQGTLILNNIQDLPEELKPQVIRLLETGVYTPVQRFEDQPAEPRPCQARILMISERALPEIDGWVKRTIKVPPLRVRKTDIRPLVEYYMSLLTQSRGLPKPKLTPEAIRRLQSYDFPGNLRELRSVSERAVDQSGGSQLLTEEVFWSTESKTKRFRINLLNAYPELRKFLRSPWWPDRINTWLVMPSFALVVFLLFWGPQDRQHNMGLNLFWAWWWPVVLILFPFLGRIWCAVCPFMIYGEVVQKISLWLFPRQLQRWPRQAMEQWAGWFLFGSFALIFLWEEIWDLSNTAYLSSWLLLLITAGAVICSVIFERRFWCRYLCPIGGMNGLYGKLAMIELRAQQGTCSAECTTYQCYKGGPEKGEGMETNGCPVYSHPAQLQDNKDCVLCMTCLKACPHRSVELNLRPPAIELWTTHTPRASEVALLLLLLGGIYLHRLPEIQAQWGLTWDLDPFGIHLGISCLALALPTLIPLLAQALIQMLKTVPRPRSFLEMSYGYLPLVLGGTLAHYLRLGLGEAGQILPVTWATFGFSGEQLPVVIAHPAVVAFLQGITLIFSCLLTWALTQRIGKQPFFSLWPQHLGSLVLTISLWSLIVGR